MLEDKRQEGIRGWLLVYVIASIPPLMFYSAGLSGWFFDYPWPLFLAIFLLLVIPLLLVLLRSPKAPRWNIAALWIMAGLMTLRIVSALLFRLISEEQPPLDGERLLAALPILSGVILFALVWAIGWTKYFKASVRVRNTFSQSNG